MWPAEAGVAIKDTKHAILPQRLDEPEWIRQDMQKYTAAQWHGICQSASDTSDDAWYVSYDNRHRSDRQFCNALGALHFVDTSFCLEMNDATMHFPKASLATSCITAVALQQNDNSICNTDADSVNYCNERFNRIENGDDFRL